MISFDFGGKNVVVAGGTSGINRGIAEHFAEEGANVSVIGRNQEKVRDTVQSLEKRGVGALGFSADVRNYQEIVACIKSVASQWGNIDVLVSGAAGNFPATLNGMSPNGFKAVVEIDLLGTFHVMKAAFPYLVKPGASVINISAPQAIIPMMAQSHVCAAKAGVDMITRTLSFEWGIEGVRVNSVIPGPIEGTEGMARLAPSKELQEACVESVPLKRLGSVRDISSACLFLSSPFASYINGAVIPVDGGWVNGGVASLSASLGKLLQSS